MKHIKIFIVLFLLTATLTSCSTIQRKSAISGYDYSKIQLVQLDAIEGNLDAGEEQDRPIAVITTTLGVIKIALYPEYAPNTVKNFIDRVNEGFYNDTLIFGVRQEAFYSGVDSDNKTKTTDGELIENEYSVNMWPFKGAIASYSNVDGFSDSRFFIVNEEDLTEEEFEQLAEMPIREQDGLPYVLPGALIDAFKELGGAVTLSGLYTIFGQTIEGFNVLEDICKSETDRQSKPIEEIKIITIELI